MGKKWSDHLPTDQEFLGSIPSSAMEFFSSRELFQHMYGQLNCSSNFSCTVFKLTLTLFTLIFLNVHHLILPFLYISKFLLYYYSLSHSSNICPVPSCDVLRGSPCTLLITGQGRPSSCICIPICHS